VLLTPGPVRLVLGEQARSNGIGGAHLAIVPLYRSATKDCSAKVHQRHDYSAVALVPFLFVTNQALNTLSDRCENAFRRLALSSV